MGYLSGDVIELLIHHQPSVKPSLTLGPFGVLGYVAGHSLTVLGLITGVLGLIMGVLGLITGVGFIMGVNIRIGNILFTCVDGTWAKGPGCRMCAKY